MRNLNSQYHISPVLWRPPKSRNPYNVKPFLTDISATVAQIQKFQKTRCIFFEFWFWSAPSQLVSNPFNWSPNTVFYRYLGISCSNPNNSKNKVHFFSSNFASGRTLHTNSTGPQPIQLVPKHCFLQICQYRLPK